MKGISRNLWIIISTMLVLATVIIFLVGCNFKRTIFFNSRKVSPVDLYTLEEKTLAEGKNKTPVGLYELKTYRVEELTLPQLMNVTVSGQTIQVDKAWRVTIRGGQFPLRSLPYVIWIDDTILGSAKESENLSEITTIIYDRSLLLDGATIGVS